jgi:hypothetical protein
MPQAPAAIFKIPTKAPQPPQSSGGKTSGRAKAGKPAPGKVRTAGTDRSATRGSGDVIVLGHGMSVYPARVAGGHWRAVWYEGGARRPCEAASEDKLAAKLEKVLERLAAGAPNMRRLGADLIAHYLDLDRLPVTARWSRRHADTQRRLCQRFAARVPGGYPIADRLATRIAVARAEQESTTALFNWKLDATRRVPDGGPRQLPHHPRHVRRHHRRRPGPRTSRYRITTAARDERPFLACTSVGWRRIRAAAII